MPARFTYRRSVAFSETDLAGIVHFSNFFRFMEDSEHAFYRSLGYSVHGMDDGEGGSVGWPRVQAECDYRRPLRFENEFEIDLEIVELGNKTVNYSFTFWLLGEGGERAAEPLAIGRMVVVCVRFESGSMRSVAIPESIRDKIAGN